MYIYIFKNSLQTSTPVTPQNQFLNTKIGPWDLSTLTVTTMATKLLTWHVASMCTY